jgi:hypothetical protein
MPPLISADDLRDRFDISPDIKDPRLTPAIGSASRRLRKWVGEMNYALASAGTDPDMLSDLQNAEAHLAYSLAIYGLNSPMTKKGVVTTSQSDQGKEMRKYLSPKETAELATYFLNVAQEIAAPYITDDGSVVAGIGISGTKEEAEASTREWNAGSSCC